MERHPFWLDKDLKYFNLCNIEKGSLISFEILELKGGEKMRKFLTALLLVAPSTALAQSADPWGANALQNLNIGTKNIGDTIAGVINVVLSFLGILATGIILLGGFKWMTAGGNDEGVTEARKLIFSGIIGIAIILSAWAIAQFVIDNLGKATGAEGYVIE